MKKQLIAPHSALQKSTTLLLAGIGLFVTAHHSEAALLLSEDFNYALTESLVGKSGGTGWTGAWEGASSGTATSTIVSGLTFSDYGTTGNAVRLDLTRLAATTDIALGRGIGTGIGSDTSLYSSFLFSMNTSLNVETGTRVQITSATNTNSSESYFRNISRRTNSNRLGISAGDSAISTTGQFPAPAGVFEGATLLYVSRLSNVGTGPTQDGKMWLLNAANWDAFKNTGMTEADLDTNSITSVNRTTTSTKGFSTSEFIQLTAGLNADNSSFAVTYDELRYGTSLASIVIVPEPSTALLGALGVLGLLHRRCRA